MIYIEENPALSFESAQTRAVPAPTLEQLLVRVRDIVADYDSLEINVNSLTFVDLGIGDGYAASLDFLDELKSDDYEYWWEAADTFPRTATGKTATEAVIGLIGKAEKEMRDYVAKNFLYSPDVREKFLI